jgi:hypothetical protein
MRKSPLILAGAGLLALAAGAGFAQPGSGEATAVYWMTADTMSGMGGMMGMSRGAMLGQMMRGRGMGGGTARTLRLQLGSARRPAGPPTAEHLPPPGLQAGPSLPLVTPEQARPTPESAPTEWTRNMERPKGRILIYWGCGDHARPGQPVVIDFESLSQGRLPPAFANLMAMRGALPPSPERFATYGEWPNARNSSRIQAGASLVGEHVVRGNYTPDIRFTLGPNQDFMPPVTLTSNSAGPGGAMPLAWQPIAQSRGWLLTAMGAGGNGDMVMWTSSETQAMAMGLDHMTDAELARLVQQRVLLPGAADRCTVPAEVAGAGRGAMLTVTAFGGEHMFSNPLRPARASAGWRPDWLVRLRLKSSYMGILGMNMPAMGDEGADRGDGNRDPGQPQPKKKKSIFDRAIGGMIPH